MALYTELTSDEIAEAFKSFGLKAPTEVRPEPRGIINTNYHVWVGSDRYFFRLAEGKTGFDAAYEVAVHSYLEEAQFPVPHLCLSGDGGGFVALRNKPAMIFRYAPGEEVRLREATPEHCRRVGQQLGRLHDLAAGFAPQRENPYGPSRVRTWMNDLSERPKDPEIEAAWPVFQDELTSAHALPAGPQGLAHCDLFVDNVLWLGGRISAILDWEMACTAPFAYDLGVAVNAWCFTDAFDRVRAHALFEGYRSRRKRDTETFRLLYPYARYAALRFTVSRLHAFHGTGLGGVDRVAPKDWRRYRNRLIALREMGEKGFQDLLWGSSADAKASGPRGDVP